MSGRAPPPSTERVLDDTLKPAVRTFGRRYSKALLQAVDWCLKMDPTQRPQTVHELLDYLNQSWIADLEQQRGGYLERLRTILPWGR